MINNIRANYILELIDMLIMLMRHNGDEDEYLTLIDLMNKLILDDVFTIESFKFDVNKLKSNEIKKAFIFCFESNEKLENVKEINLERYSKHISNFIDIFEVIRTMLEKKQFDEVMAVAYSVHNYPGYLMGEYKYKGDNLWISLQSYYKHKYNAYFLSENRDRYK